MAIFTLFITQVIFILEIFPMDRILHVAFSHYFFFIMINLVILIALIEIWLEIAPTFGNVVWVRFFLYLWEQFVTLLKHIQLTCLKGVRTWHVGSKDDHAGLKRIFLMRLYKIEVFLGK